MPKPEARSKRIQIRLTPDEDALLADIASELHTTKHTVGSMAMSLGLTAFRKAIDAGHASVATLPMFTPRSDDPDEWIAYQEAQGSPVEQDE